MIGGESGFLLSIHLTVFAQDPVPNEKFQNGISDPSLLPFALWIRHFGRKKNASFSGRVLVGHWPEIVVVVGKVAPYSDVAFST